MNYLVSLEIFSVCDKEQTHTSHPDSGQNQESTGPNVGVKIRPVSFTITEIYGTKKLQNLTTQSTYFSNTPSWGDVAAISPHEIRLIVTRNTCADRHVTAAFEQLTSSCILNILCFYSFIWKSNRRLIKSWDRKPHWYSASLSLSRVCVLCSDYYSSQTDAISR